MSYLIFPVPLGEVLLRQALRDLSSKVDGWGLLLIFHWIIMQPQSRSHNKKPGQSRAF